MSVSHVSKTFTSGGRAGSRRVKRALSDVSIDVCKGETLGLVGESGCGKTTLGRIILGMEKPDSGEVLIEGEDLNGDSRTRKSVRGRMQMVFQNPYEALDPKMRIERCVTEPLRAHHACSSTAEYHERASALMELVGLSPSLLSRLPKQLSGGQRQRVCIARALALDPLLIVSDEPVSALDVSAQAQILNLMRELGAKEHLTNLFISHDLAVVRYVADRVAIMYMGHLCELGPSEEIFEHPRHPYTELLLASVPHMQRSTDETGPADDGMSEEGEDEVVDGETVAITASAPESGCPFHPRCAKRMDCCRERTPVMRKCGASQVACHLWDE